VLIAARLFVIFVLVGIGGAVAAWLLTGDSRYRRAAWLCFRIACVLLLFVMALLALERLL